MQDMVVLLLGIWARRALDALDELMDYLTLCYLHPTPPLPPCPPPSCCCCPVGK